MAKPVDETTHEGSGMYNGDVTPMPEVGLAGSIILTVLLMMAAAALAWYFAKKGSKDLEDGKGPLFLYGRKR